MNYQLEPGDTYYSTLIAPSKVKVYQALIDWILENETYKVTRIRSGETLRGFEILFHYRPRE